MALRRRLEAHLVENGLAAHARQRLLARRIDVRHKQLFHVAKRPAEFLLQKLRPAESMRLKRTHHALRFQPLRRRQGRRDLAGVMSVVVHHGAALARVADLKTPLRAAEGFQRMLNGIESHAQSGRQ